jgi:hypothetical protein
MLSELPWAPRKSVSCCVYIEALSVYVGGGMSERGGLKSFLLELIKGKITKQVTLSVVVFSYFLL